MSEALRKSGGLTLAVLASRVLGVAREALFAALFGAGAQADAYQVAFRIPNLLRDLFAEGALSSAFVPTFAAAYHDHGSERGFRLANTMVGLVLIVTGGLTAAGMVWAEEIVGLMSSGFAGDAAKLALAVELTRTMMPLLSLVSLGAVWMGMLNARSHFLVPAYAPAVFNLVSIAFGLALTAGAFGTDVGLRIWSVGTVIAGVFQAGVQLPALWRLGYRPWPRLAGWWRDPGVRRVGALMAPAVLGLAAVQVNVFVNTRFAAELGDGPVAQLGYAFRLFYLPIGMFGVALATVTTAGVSLDAARGELAGVAARTREGLTAGWMLASASAVGLFVLAEPVVALVYERGAFGERDTLATAEVLRAYLIGLLPYSLAKILAPGFYARDRSRVPLLGSLAAVVVNLAFNAATYRTLGAPGIALGTSLGAFANLVVLRWAFSRLDVDVDAAGARGSARRLLALGVANLVLALAVTQAWRAVELGRDRVDAGWQGIVEVSGLGAVIVGGFFLYAGVLRGLTYPGGGVLFGLPASIVRRLSGRSRAGRNEPPNA